MIEIQHISKAFGDKKIIDNVSAQFKPGMCNLIIGASGSGKTVLIKCIVDLIQTDQGKVLFCLLYTSPSPRDRQKSRMPSSA